MRVEENSGVQKVERTRGECGEDGTGMGCGEGPARKERGQPGRPPARGTRTLGRCSFDARNRGSTRLSPKEVGKRAWKDHLERGGGGPVGLLCSRNAHAQNVLVRRAQWETKQATLP